MRSKFKIKKNEWAPRCGERGGAAHSLILSKSLKSFARYILA